MELQICGRFYVILTGSYIFVICLKKLRHSFLSVFLNHNININTFLGGTTSSGNSFLLLGMSVGMWYLEFQAKLWRDLWGNTKMRVQINVLWVCSIQTRRAESWGTYAHTVEAISVAGKWEVNLARQQQTTSMAEYLRQAIAVRIDIRLKSSN